MKMRSMVRLAGAIVLAAVLGLGVPVPHPARADPADTRLAYNTQSRLYTPHGCLYKVMFGNFGPTAYAVAHVYNPNVCGDFLVVIQYNNGLTAYSASLGATGSDGCGTYRVIHVSAPTPSIAERALIALEAGGGYNRWYAPDGTHNQPSINC